MSLKKIVRRRKWQRFRKSIRRGAYSAMRTVSVAYAFTGIIVMAGAEGLAKNAPMTPLMKTVLIAAIGLTMLIGGAAGYGLFGRREREELRKEKRARERQLQTGA